MVATARNNCGHSDLEYVVGCNRLAVVQQRDESLPLRPGGVKNHFQPRDLQQAAQQGEGLLHDLEQLVTANLHHDDWVHKRIGVQYVDDFNLALRDVFADRAGMNQGDVGSGCLERDVCNQVAQVRFVKIASIEPGYGLRPR